jgi:phosphate transport system substrate-binding protein
VRYTKLLALPCCAALALGAAACGGEDASDSGSSSGGSAASGGQKLSGTIKIDGSSTVFPLAQAAAETFQQQNPDVKITVGESGTGGGFEKFCNGETDISDASRPIEDDEKSACSEKTVTFDQIQVANDGIAVVSNPSLKIDCLTTAQLKQLWATNEVKTYNRVDPELPDAKVSLFGPGTDSGTFDFFTEEVNGEEGASRTDYQASEDDNVLVQGVSGDPNALGYFGFAYYENNQETLEALAVDGVEPNTQTIRSAEYPLSRPLFIYISTQALKENKAVEPFVNFYLDNLDQYVEQARYVTLPGSLEQEARKQWEDRTTGTVYDENGELPGGDLQTALKQSQ